MYGELVSHRLLKGGLARELGLFSVGLGITQLTAPDKVAKWIGIWRRRSIAAGMRLLGARELSSGLALLFRPYAGWLWGRFAGDLIDLFLIRRSFEARRTNRRRLAAALFGVAQVGIVDLIAASLASRRSANRLSDAPSAGQPDITASITINKPPDEVYQFWRELRNIPRFMPRIVEVTELDGQRSHWVARGPKGSVEWDGEITDDRPYEQLSWRANIPARLAKGLGGFERRGCVHFTPSPDGRGTEVRFEIWGPFRKPNRLFKWAAKVPTEMFKLDLMRLKQLLEVGEVVHSDASIHRGLHPARPSSEEERRVP
jgi:uncharacterized membrane protein